MAKGGKKFAAVSQLVDRERRYSIRDAFDLLPKTKISGRFDETVEEEAKRQAAESPLGTIHQFAWHEAIQVLPEQALSGVLPSERS